MLSNILALKTCLKNVKLGMAWLMIIYFILLCMQVILFTASLLTLSSSKTENAKQSEKECDLYRSSKFCDIFIMVMNVYILGYFYALSVGGGIDEDEINTDTDLEALLFIKKFKVTRVEPLYEHQVYKQNPQLE